MKRQRTPPKAEALQAAQRLAKRAADRYFTAIATEIPFDVAPGDVNLIAAAVSIQSGLLRAGRTDDQGKGEHWALNAGYLLGVEIGRRLGGAR